MFVIWNIELKHKTCRISFSDKDQSIDSCNDGKSLRNTSAGQSYLHIPNFSADEVGVYRCESVYTGGNEYYKFEVAVTAPPKVSAWLERRDNKVVAVCRAEKGYPAAKISWSPAGNGSVTLQDEPDGFVTVESWLELSGDMDPENLTCVVHHQFWAKEKTLVPKLKEGQASLDWMNENAMFYFNMIVRSFFNAVDTCCCHRNRFSIINYCSKKTFLAGHVSSETSPTKWNQMQAMQEAATSDQLT
ncbi:cell surface glycoprotein CD200 receptor 1-B-like [Girardinichthys multiradiatus]|uniref:cell surface glycoprotein CD200 receptor 1-B-like n=1 Tax=Girardinichthys multiradiatus TaxID=208333 RepID=UPI001FAE3809|nr:cell surface glycoprotein CD200 receptor 1-B-like [Girardinichthys multiradiatus]